MKLEEAQTQLNVVKLGDGEPKNIFLSDAARDKIGSVHLGDDYFAYKRGALTSFAGGVINTIQDLSNYGSRLKVFGGQGLMAVGDMVGSEKTTEIGKEMIQVAQHNIDKVNQNLQYASPEELESFASNLGGGAVNYGLMFLTGGVSGAGAKALGMSASAASKVAGASVFSTMFGLSAGMEAQERVDVYKQRTGDKALTGYTPSMAGKNFVASAIYGIGEGALEKWAFKEQKILFKNPLTAIKTGAISGLKEGGTEATQSLLNIGIDLADGTLYWKDLPEAVKGVIMEAAVGGTLGFTAGMGVGYANRSNAIKELSKQLSGTIKNPEEATAVAKEVVDNSINTLQGVIATELKLSTELKDKYGETFNSMQVAVKNAMDNSGAFKDMTEDEVAQYATETARRFADEVVAEANKRNVLMQDVVNSNDIVYKDGKLHLAPTEAKKRVLAAKKNKPTSLLTFLIRHGGIKDTNGELSVLDAQKGRPGLVNNKYGLDLDRARELAEEAGYFGVVAKNNLGSTTVDDLLTLIDKELRGERVFTEESITQQLEETKEDYSEAEAYYERYLEENGVDYEGLTFEQKKEAYEQIMPKEEIESGLEINDEGILLDEFGNELFQEQFELKEEMDAIDMHNDAYEGETININGVERTVYNSNGDRIAKSEPALRAFYSWFGDSKVVDGQGRPLVVYHGTTKEFDTFSKDKIVRGNGFWFTTDKAYAQGIRRTEGAVNVLEVYLSANNVIDVNKDRKQFITLAKEHLKDEVDFSDVGDNFIISEAMSSKTFPNFLLGKGINAIKMGGGYEVFNPNQIKSVDNRGTFSESENIYLQSAYAGSRVDYDKPSLEAIGSGEGNQAHGWGLYYALNKEVAEHYRRAFTGFKYDGKEWKDTVIGQYSSSFGQALLTGKKDRVLSYFRDKLYRAKTGFEYYQNKDTKGLSRSEKQDIKDSIENAKEKINKYSEVVDFVENFSEEKIETAGGQVHEVDIPENPYLLDEQKKFSEQSDFVKNNLAKVGAKYIFDMSGLSEAESVAEASRIMNDWDGGGIYNRLSDEVGGDRKASQLLEKHGIKGITYDGRQDGRCFVIFNPDDVKVVQKFYQVKGLPKGKAIKRGSFDAGEKVIQLFEDANTSTLPHELSHFWLDNMWTYANSGVASETYKAQFEGVKNFLGVKPNQTYLTRQQHEKFASAYEKYVWRGEFPTPIMGVVFGNYERWLRRVYDSIADIQINGKGRVRLTPEIIKFFDSMTTGALPSYDAQIETQIRTEEAKEYDEKLTKEAREVVMKSPEPVPVSEPMKPVETTGKEKESRLYERLKGIVGAEDSLGYNVANIAENREKAKKIWEENPEKAQAILDGKENVDDVLRQAVFTEQQRLALDRGDTATYLKSLRKQSAEATRLGQELSALRGVVEDITMPSYWIRMAESESHKQLAKKMASYFDNVMGKSVLENFTAQLDADIKALQESVVSKTTTEEKSKALTDGINSLKKKYKGLKQPETTFFQTDYTNEEAAYDYIEKKAKEAIGLSLSDKDANAIIQAASDLDKLSQTLDEFGVPSEAFFVKKAELEKMVNEHTPTSRLKVLLSVIGRANMLTAPATSVLNITTNAQNYATQMALRKANNAFAGKTNDNIVGADIQKQYRNKVWRTFWNTGYDISMMQNLTDTRLYKGEDVTHSEGVGAIRQLGRWAEEYVFRKMISTPDVYFKSLKAFTEFAGNEATDVAYKEGLTGEHAKKRANELFLDATRIEPATETGMAIRNKAQTDALIITFQQDTQLSESLLNLRKAINKLTGDIGIGEILSPFVKTPANILSLGMDATLGAFASPVNLFGALTDIKNGTYNTARVQRAVRQMTTFGLSHIIVALLLNSLIDDDDYIPDYSQLTQTERNAVKERGASFGSVRIGDTFVSTDFFGALEMPLVAVLNARRQEGVIPVVGAYMGSIVREALDAPVIKDAITSSEALKEVGQGSLSVHEAVYDAVGDIVSSRMIPNAINTVAKISDDYERKTNGRIIDKIKARIPLLRETLEPQISVATGREIETQSAILQALFGSRAKEERVGVVVQELARLAEAGQGVSLSDITRSGDLKKLPDNLKPQVLREFAEEYAKKVSEKIKSDSYRRKSDEEKKEVINKVRKNIVDGIKRRYVKKLKQGRW